MKKGFRELIELRVNRPGSMKKEDYLSYLRQVIRLIEKVYQSRYGYESVKDNQMKNLGGHVLSEKEHKEVIVTLNYEIFQDECLDLMEDELVYIVNDRNFESENALKGYLNTTFENILQDKIDKQTPGFATRKKQVYRVLRDGFETVRILKQECWRLKGSSITEITPYDKLSKIAQEYQAPPLQYPKPGSKNGPFIMDKDMQEYLLNILQDVRGVVRKQDLISLIMHEYGITTSKTVDLNCDDDSSSEEEVLSNLAKSFVAGETCSSMIHVEIAKNIVGQMDDSMKEVFLLLYEKELNQSEIAKQLQRSDATISNGKKKIENLLTKNIFGSDIQLDFEEAMAVIQIVMLIINREKKKVC